MALTPSQAKKLGLRPGHRVALDQPPPGWSLAAPPPNLVYVGATQPADVVVGFFRAAAQLPERLPDLAQRIRPDGALWVAWPRRAAGHTSDITDHIVRRHALALGLVDVMVSAGPSRTHAGSNVAAIDDDWSGLRFVRRAPTVIVLNGASSAGKSSIARALQALLPDPWLTFGVDTFVDALPPEGSWAAAGQAIDFHPDGSISVGPRFRELEELWMAGVAAMARAGARIILDEVFLSGGQGQARWRKVLTGLDVLWVGVRCDPDVAEAREAARGDRIAGMARLQAAQVHAGVAYDLEIDTTATDPGACARMIQAHIEPAG